MRLIDADKLIDYFYYGIDDKPIIDGISDRKIITIIKNQSTAYDVDKVVEQLEEYKYENLVEHDYEQLQHCKQEGDCGMRDCVLCVFDKAIEIVKKCGVGTEQKR